MKINCEQEVAMPLQQHVRVQFSELESKMMFASTIPELIGAAIKVAGGSESLVLDPDEANVAKGCVAMPGLDVDALTARLIAGDDVLGEEYCRLKSSEDRRSHGATFTPDAIVNAMLDWAEAQTQPELIVDPGAGSGRYSIAAAKRFKSAKVIAVEIEPVLRIITKARVKVMGLSDRISVNSESFLRFRRPKGKGPVLYIGNPPYVRHHDIDPRDKVDYANRCKSLGVTSSGLAGLHIHFMVKVFEMAKHGDAMAFITAAEWMDTNYGRSIRQLLASGKHDVFVGSFPKEEIVFEDALTSAAISCVRFDEAASHIKVGSLSFPKKLTLGKGRKVIAKIAVEASSWNGNVGSNTNKQSHGCVLGDFFRVSRGLVTGMNDVWVVSDKTPTVPKRFLRPCITNAEDITTLTNARLTNANSLRRVVFLPKDLTTATDEERAELEIFLKWAKEKGADSTYTAKHRKYWWHIDIKDPPPIVMTYMGRRPPVFARNIAGVPLLNIAHGLYPKVELSPEELDGVVAWLNKNVSTEAGRSYAGGLVKFEPKEAMRIQIPNIKAVME